MKAPSVREGSKENGTLVTGNQIYKGCLVRQRTLTGQAAHINRSGFYPMDNCKLSRLCFKR